MIKVIDAEKVIRIMIGCGISYAICLLTGCDNEFFPLIWMGIHIILCRCRIRKICNRKLFIGIIVVSLYFAIAITAGEVLWKGMRPGIIQGIVSFAGLFILCLLFMYGIRDYMTKTELREVVQREKSTGKFMLYHTIGIFACWIPVLLINYPVIATADSVWQWQQASHQTLLTNHHPVLHTLFIRIAQTLCGVKYSNMKYASVAAFSYAVMQMLILALIYSYVLLKIRKMNLPKIVFYLCLGYYSLFPLNSLFSIYMTKDCLFSGFVLLLSILLYEIHIDEKKLMKTNFLVLMIFSLDAVVLFRSNGIFVAIITMFLLLLNYHGNRKIWIILISVCVTVVLWNGLLKVKGIQQPDISEALGTPINQIASVVCEHEDTLSASDKILVSEVIPIEEIKKLYDPGYSDPIKFSPDFKSYVIVKAPDEYLLLWGRLFIQHPLTCMRASARLTVGYWFPSVKKGAVSYATDDKAKYYDEMGITEYAGSGLMNRFIGVDVRKSILESWMYSIGIMVLFMWILLVGHIALSKRRDAVLVYIPVIVVWITIMFFSPAYCETRYVYSIFITLPLLFCITLKDVIAYKQEKGVAVCDNCK